MIAENGTRQRANLAEKVVLDFSKLFEQEKQAPESPVERVSEGNAYKTISQKEKPATGQIEGLEGQGAYKLVKKAVTEKETREEALRICREHQQNTAKSQMLQSEILKGLKAGEDVYSLFLKAAKAISLMTSNSVFYSQTEEDLKAIYGRGLQEKPPLQIELEEVQGRLQKLIEADKREKDSDSKERIQRAIQAHKNKATELREMIEKTQL